MEREIKHTKKIEENNILVSNFHMLSTYHELQTYSEGCLSFFVKKLILLISLRSNKVTAAAVISHLRINNNRELKEI